MIKPAHKFTIRPDKRPAFFRVMVFETKPDMWAWYGEDCKKSGKEQVSHKFAAMCLPHEIVRTWADGREERSPDIGTIIFAKPQLGAGTIAHEMGHAAIWYDRLINGNTRAEYGEQIGETEERMLYLLYHLVRKTVDEMHKLNLF